MLSYNPTALERGVRAAFWHFYNSAPTSYVDRLATRVSSNGTDEKYAWIGHPPQMGAVTDEIEFTPLSDASYTLENLLYGAGIEIRRSVLADDRTGDLLGQIRRLANVARMHPNKLLIDALINGTSTTVDGLSNTCYDGVAFFSASHPARGRQSSTQSNLHSGAGVTVANLKTDIGAVIAKLAGFLAENNEPINETMTKLEIVCHPTLMANFNEAIYASIISNTSNVGNRDFQISILPTARLSDTDDWFMLNVTDAGDRPLIFQEREPLEFLALDTPTSGDDAFDREVYKWKTRYRAAAGYAHWAKAVKVTNS